MSTDESLVKEIQAELEKDKKSKFAKRMFKLLGKKWFDAHGIKMVQNPFTLAFSPEEGRKERELSVLEQVKFIKAQYLNGFSKLNIHSDKKDMALQMFYASLPKFFGDKWEASKESILNYLNIRTPLEHLCIVSSRKHGKTFSLCMHIIIMMLSVPNAQFCMQVLSAFDKNNFFLQFNLLLDECDLFNKNSEFYTLKINGEEIEMHWLDGSKSHFSFEIPTVKKPDILIIEELADADIRFQNASARGITGLGFYEVLPQDLIFNSVPIDNVNVFVVHSTVKSAIPCLIDSDTNTEFALDILSKQFANCARNSAGRPVFHVCTDDSSEEVNVVIFIPKEGQRRMLKIKGHKLAQPNSSNILVQQCRFCNNLTENYLLWN